MFTAKRPRRIVLSIIFQLSMVLVLSPVGADEVKNSIDLSGRKGTIQLNERELNDSASSSDIEPGDTLKTDEGEQAKLRVSEEMLIQVSENTELTIENHETRTEERGFILTNEVTVTDLKIGVNEGRILNTIDVDEENREFDVKLNTPTAQAGVRGTSFELNVAEDGATQVGVLEGELQFQPAEAPDQQITLTANKRSTVSAPTEAPSDPQPLTDQQSNRLEDLEALAAAELSPSPVIPSLMLDEEPVTDQRVVQLNRPRSLEFQGNVQFPGNTEFDSLSLSVNGEAVPVDGTRNWSGSVEVAPPQMGETTSVNLLVTATNNFGASTTEQRTIQVSNREPAGDIPVNYTLGTLDIEVEQFALKNPDDLSFPYHLNRVDLDNGELVIEINEVNNLVGLAYSTRSGGPWRVSDGGDPYQLRIEPTEFRGNRTLWIRGWSADGVISYPIEIGDIDYQKARISDLARRIVRQKWEQFQNKRDNEILQYLSKDFFFEIPRDNVSLSRHEYQYEFLQQRFRAWRNLNVTQKVNRTAMTPSGGRVNTQLNVKGIAEDGLDFLMSATVKHELARQQDGQYLIDLVRMENSGVYKYTESLSLDHLEGLSLESVRDFGASLNCARPEQFDVCVDLVETAGGGSISGDNGIAAVDDQTTGASGSHRIKYRVVPGSNIDGSSLNSIDIKYGVSSHPSDASAVTGLESGSSTNTNMGCSDLTLSGDASGISSSNGGKQLNITYTGNCPLDGGDVITITTDNNLVNPNTSGNHPVDVNINNNETKSFQLEIIDDAANKKIIPSSEREATIKRLAESDPFRVNRLPSPDQFTSASRVLNANDLFGVRTQYRGEERSALLDFQTVSGGVNGSASVRLIVGETIVGGVAVEEYPEFNIFRQTGTP